jgi:hypothetical protein
MIYKLNFSTDINVSTGRLSCEEGVIDLESNSNVYELVDLGDLYLVKEHRSGYYRTMNKEATHTSTYRGFKNSQTASELECKLIPFDILYRIFREEIIPINSLSMLNPKINYRFMKGSDGQGYLYQEEELSFKIEEPINLITEITEVDSVSFEMEEVFSEN